MYSVDVAHFLLFSVYHGTESIKEIDRETHTYREREGVGEIERRGIEIKGGINRERQRCS